MNNYPSYLMHYGIKGQKWGVRRYQNEDGSYTEEGKRLRRVSFLGKELSQRDAVRMRRSQNKLNEKFNKKTEKILEDKRYGKTISPKRLKEVEKLGTEVRKWDYIAKDPIKYTSSRKSTAYATLASSFLGGLVLAIPVATVLSIIETKDINNYYKKEFEEAKDLTMKDLKKHGIY